MSGILAAVLLVALGPPPAVGSLHPTGDEARQVSSELAGGKGRGKWTPGKGLEVATPDKRFSLTLYTLTQLQAIVRHIPAIPGTDGKPDIPEANTLQVVLRRARIVLSGNIFTPHIKYKIQLTASPIEMGFRDGVPHRSPILDWTYTFERLRDFTVQIGQYKVPYNHERMLRISGLHLIDRSAANNEFTLDRDIGLDIRSKDVGGLGRLRYYAGIYLGDGIARFGPTDPGLMYTARVEVLPFGLYVFARESIKVQFDYTHLWNADIRLGTGQARLQFQATF